MLHDMPVGFVPGTAGLVPGLVAVSSPPSHGFRPWDRRSRPRSRRRLVPPDSVAICRFPTIASTWQTSIVYEPSSACIVRPAAAAPSLTSRRRLSPPHQTLSPPSRWTRSPPSRRTLSPPPPLLSLPSLQCFQNSAISVANACKNKMVDAAGCMVVVDSNVQHRQVTLKNHCI